MPKEFGGAEADALTIALALETLGYGCKDNGLIFALNAQMWACEVPLVRFGTEEQKRRYLPQLCDGTLIAAQAMSEPGSGSDAFGLATRAVRRGNVYALTGSKTFVTNAPEADVFLVYATTDPGQSIAGLCAFVIDRETPGLVVGPPVRKMGLRTSPMSELFLDACEVAAEQLLGKPGSGMAIFNRAMLWERSLILASAVGTMRRQLERCIEYARERQQFGQAIGSYQAVSHRIVEMQLRLETARLLLYRLGWSLAAGECLCARRGAREAVRQRVLSAVQLGCFADLRRLWFHDGVRAGARRTRLDRGPHPLRDFGHATEHRRALPRTLSGRLLQDLLGRSSQSHPSRLAVRDRGRDLTYEELEVRASSLAGVLRELGVAKGDRVGLYLDKQAHALTGIYGVLKAGAALRPAGPWRSSGLPRVHRGRLWIRVLVTGVEKASCVGGAARQRRAARGDCRGERRPGRGDPRSAGRRSRSRPSPTSTPRHP